MENTTPRKTITRSHPAWERPAFLGLLGATAVLYLWNLAASGWANAYYSAAVLAGAERWAALFFGSPDAPKFLNVDKAPGPLWVLGVAPRPFRFNPRAVLAPQPARARAPHQAVAAGPADDGRRLRVVGGRGRAVPQRVAPVYRWIAEQRPAQPDLRIQRLWPPDRQRIRERRWLRRPRVALGAHGLGSPLQRPVRWTDLLADPRGHHLPGRRATPDMAPAPDRHRPGRVPDLGRRAAADWRGVQLRPGHHSPVLHRGPGTGDRRAGRHGRGLPLGTAVGSDCSPRPRGFARPKRRLVLHPARPFPGLLPRPPAGRPGPWPARRHHDGDPIADVALDTRVDRGAGDRGGTCGPGGLRSRHGIDPTRRRHSLGRPSRRSRWSGRRVWRRSGRWRCGRRRCRPIPWWAWKPWAQWARVGGWRTKCRR